MFRMDAQPNGLLHTYVTNYVYVINYFTRQNVSAIHLPPT